ncbi:MAG: LysE/ArgO family amino acid transporter [Aeromicrobium sp.]|uniref:LysE/ArgO family amino acid transporter n=1 Tax=Aeromicrobium sp. TaxID=1871063 RepID=UPI0039E60A4B
MLTAVVAGLLTGLSLIVAIGAQNAFVLRQGLRRERVGVVVAICAASDALLIAFGVAGLGGLLSAAPWLSTAARWAGAVFLLGYAALALWRAAVGGAEGLNGGAAGGRGGLGAVAGTTLALTWLNPHVYLDTVFLVGSIAATHGEARWWFAAGAMSASVMWFGALGFGAGRLGRWLRSSRAWRLLDAVIALAMIVIAVTLLIE